MSTRSFLVFQDSLSEEVDIGSRVPIPSKLSKHRSASQEIAMAFESILSPAREKENVHPVTGITASSSQMNKKRKASETNGVLSTKSLTTTNVSSSKSKLPELKRHKSAFAEKPEKSKRKNSLSRKGGESRRILGSSENATSLSRESTIRQPRSLSREPTVVLDTVEEHLPSTGLGYTKATQQALIDSRCRELTMLPLADVSNAYLESPITPKIEFASEENVQLATIKEVGDQESSFETHLKDYFTPTCSGSLTSSTSESSVSTSVCSPTTATHSPDFKVFRDGKQETPKKPLDAEIKKHFELSTPVRRELYATFTFASPSSSSASRGIILSDPNCALFDIFPRSP